MANRTLLILTYYWPPAGGAGVQRWLKFVKYLSSMGYEPHIYTAENPEAPAQDESLLSDIPSNVVVIKKPIWEPFHFYKKLTRKKGNFNAGFLSEENNNKKKWTEKLALFIRANIFVPDAKMFWIKPSTKFLKQYIKQENIELIISSGPPHSLHLIALNLKKKLGVKWIADFRDPWTNIDFYQELPMLNMIDKKQKKLEKKVLEQADSVIVIGQEMKREFQAIHPQIAIKVISNGFDSEIANQPILDKNFTILHIGSINSDRTHESFYHALHSLLHENPELQHHLKIKFIGKVDFTSREMIKKYQLTPFTEYTNYIAYSQISQIQQSARLLYLPLNNTPNAKGILTGKFFEYLAAKRPIIAQGPIDGDVAEILKETNAGLIFGFNDDENLKEEIKRQFHLYLNESSTFNSKNIEQYSRKNLTIKLAEIINLEFKKSNS
ncbi:MAG: glycosyltransferase [Bacteroidales bacterium]|nr:glycosyltransferase [Bacteroidales bacterium]